MRRSEVDRLDPRKSWWVPAVVSPTSHWAGAPGAHRGSRYLVNCRTLQVSRDEFDLFESRLGCLQWILENRASLNRAMPGVTVRAVRLDRWLLGMD